jgi:hypothetical protein
VPQYASDSNDAIKHETKDFKLLGSTTNNTVAGLPAYKSIYSYAGDNNSTVQGMEIGAIKGDNAYIFTYEAGPNEYDRYLPTIRNMIYSFQVPSQISPQPNATSETATPLVGDTQLQEYAVVFPPLVNMHFGVYHNEKGVFIPWKTICSKTQQYLAESCDSLINPDGSLTSQGDRAVGCIWNGAIITGAANMLHLPLATITGILGGLAQPTGCGGIVNMNRIQSSPMVQNFQQFLPNR